MNFLTNLIFSTKRDLDKFCKLIVSSFEHENNKKQFAENLNLMKGISERLEKKDLSYLELWVIPNQLSKTQYHINTSPSPGFGYYDDLAKMIFSVLPKNIESHIIKMCLEEKLPNDWLKLIDTEDAHKAHALIIKRMREEAEEDRKQAEIEREQAKINTEMHRAKRINEVRSAWGENWDTFLGFVKQLKTTPVHSATAYIEEIIESQYRRKDKVLIEEPREDRVMSSISDEGSGYYTAHLISNENDLLLAINYSRVIPQLVESAKIVSKPIPHLRAHHYWEQYMGTDAPSGTNTIFIFRVRNDQYLCWDFSRPI